MRTVAKKNQLRQYLSSCGSPDAPNTAIVASKAVLDALEVRWGVTKAVAVPRTAAAALSRKIFIMVELKRLCVGEEH